MTAPALRTFVACDFTGETLAAFLRNDESAPALAAEARPLRDFLAGDGGGRWDVGMAWALPESVSPAYRAVAAGGSADARDLERDADRYADELRVLAARAGLLVVPTLLPACAPSAPRSLERRPGIGPAWALGRLNARLDERVGGATGVIPLDAWRLVAETGGHAWSPKLWYLAKNPFDPEFLLAAARAVKSAVRGATGGARKAIVLDLDGTLWGGIVGDDGWENLRLGGHDHAGEAYADFQRALRSLARRGVILAIASRNDESIALEAIDRHPEMILRRDDFSARRIGWGDKAAGVAELARELNLGLDALVFIDDSPAERARVREALPEVLVPEWPTDPMLYPSALAALDCFDRPNVTAEDRSRGALQAASSRHDRARDAAGKTETEWVRDLGVRVEARPLGPADLPRAAQLLNKTNQFNLSTRRLPEAELGAWAEEGDRGALVFRVRDRFGEYGLVGLASYERAGGSARLVDFLLSCRVFGRRVEDAMLCAVIAAALEDGTGRLEVTLLPTARNAPTRAFLERSPLAPEPGDPHRFFWSGREAPPFPEGVTLTVADA